MSTNQKIAIPCDAPGGLKAQVNSRFGRCPYFTIVHLNNESIEEVEIVENKAINAMGGAGPMAVQLIAKEGATIIIGAHYGPNAANALLQGGIRMFGVHPGTVAEIIEAYQRNELPEISSATVGSHNGMGGRGQGMGQGRGQGQGRGRNF